MLVSILRPSAQDRSDKGVERRLDLSHQQTRCAVHRWIASKKASNDCALYWAEDASFDQALGRLEALLAQYIEEVLAGLRIRLRSMVSWIEVDVHVLLDRERYHALALRALMPLYRGSNPGRLASHTQLFTNDSVPLQSGR
jgi:hypothetical protein